MYWDIKLIKPARKTIPVMDLGREYRVVVLGNKLGVFYG